jgi:hypothetical protein
MVCALSCLSNLCRIIETRNVTPYKGYEPKLRFTKSTVHVSVSREMIDFMVNELDLTRLMKRIEESGSVVDGRQMYKDELLIGTLNAEDAIGAPGNFTHHCIDEGVDSPGLTACVCSYFDFIFFLVWSFGNTIIVLASLELCVIQSACSELRIFRN